MLYLEFLLQKFLHARIFRPMMDLARVPEPAQAAQHHNSEASAMLQKYPLYSSVVSTSSDTYYGEAMAVIAPAGNTEIRLSAASEAGKNQLRIAVQ